MQPTSSDGGASGFLLSLFCIYLPLIIIGIPLTIVGIRYGIRRYKQKRAERAAAPTQEETVPQKKGHWIDPLTLLLWYATEGHSIDGVTPLNALPTMQNMLAGEVTHLAREVFTPLPTRRSANTKSLKHRIREEDLIEVEEPEVEEEQDESVERDEPEEMEQDELPDDDEDEQQESSFPLPVKTPVQQPTGEVPFKDLPRVDHSAFCERVMEIYTEGLEKQEQHGGRLTRDTLGVKKAEWELLFKNPEGILRAGFTTDHPEGGFILDGGQEALERLSTLLQGYYPGKDGSDGK